jgi:hypothetical protein
MQVDSGCSFLQYGFSSTAVWLVVSASDEVNPLVSLTTFHASRQLLGIALKWMRQARDPRKVILLALHLDYCMHSATALLKSNDGLAMLPSTAKCLTTCTCIQVTLSKPGTCLNA